MSLAQVVYNISNDSEFAALWRSDPEAALARRGYQLSREEKAFITRGLHKNSAEGSKISLSDIAALRVGWS